MRDYREIFFDKLQWAVGLMLILSIIFVLWGKTAYVEYVNSWGTSIVASIMTTGVCQILIQRLSGDFFEKIPLTVPIMGMRFSLPLFVVITILVKIILFR